MILSKRQWGSQGEKARSSPAGGPVVPGPPIWNRCPPFHVWSPGCYMHPILFLKCDPPSGFWPALLLNLATGLGKGRYLSPGAAFWGRELRLECHVPITKCRMWADANKYELQNVECQSLIPSCKISSRSPRFAKRAITNHSDAVKASLVSPATSARMWFDWRLRHNAFR